MPAALRPPLTKMLLSALCVVLGISVLAASASAAPTDHFVFKSSFDGSSLPAGSFSAGSLGVNTTTGNIVLYDGTSGNIEQVDPTGKPVNFSGLGSPTISLEKFENFFSKVRVMVDNTPGPTRGNIYVLKGGEALYGFGPDGKSLSANYPIPTSEYSCGAGLGPNGNVWITSWNFGPPPGAVEYTPAGVPTGKEIPLPGIQFANCTTVFDSLGNLYVGAESGAVDKYDPAKGYADEGPTGETNGTQFAVDPNTNDLFVDHGSSITGTRYSDPLVKSSPFETIGGISSTGMAFGSTGETLYVAEGARIDVFHREPPSPPSILGPIVLTKVRSESAFAESTISANGAVSSYHFEFGPDTSYGQTFPVPDVPVPFSHFPLELAPARIEGLKPDTTYHLRLVVTNSAGTTYGPDRVFTTYATPPGGVDPCPNALERKQTGAQTLLDCRAYELVSAADTAGYDVESSLVPTQKPFASFPLASDPPRVLYGTHAGAIPGPWNPTNKGPDPYVATRGADGWSTQYVGLPANINPKAGSFSSALGGADAGLDTFAFAGAGLCAPCFSSGLETGIPLRLSSGQLVQGMSGSLDPGVASAKPEGKVAKYFSADGTHLVFASKYAFEPGANDNGTDLTVYDRNLSTGTTQIVSTDSAGATLTGAVISELDLSSDGSRIVVGKKVSTDGTGNEYVHPYMHLGNSPNSVDLAPGSTSGVLYAGMTANGSKVFFTTVDKLLPADTDTSADLYEADVDSSGTATLSLVTQGNSNSCSPTFGVSGCGAVAIGGGGGVASQSGAVYFLSPESFGGKGTLDQPNLYLAQPGAAPSFVATLEPGNPLVVDSVKAAAAPHSGDFETTPSGAYAVFRSNLALTGVSNFGFLSAFRYDAAGDQIACPSCDPTGAGESRLAADASFASQGLSLTDDGRVFFTTLAPLVLNDTGEREDVYEWGGSDPKLISAGIGSFDSGLLGVSHDGVDAYFFTHDKLSPVGQNGTMTRIYDARSNGGFLVDPVAKQCAASDECHGAGTEVPPTPSIRTAAPGSEQNVPAAKRCKKNFVKKRGKCVKSSHKKKNHKKKNQRKAHKHA